MVRELDLRLYLVTDEEMARRRGRTLLEVVEFAVMGGATVVQLRDKRSSSRDLLEKALALKELLDGHGVPLIVNDRLDVALAAGADGVHLGEEDIPVALARDLMPEGIIGASAGTVEEALRAQEEGADYLGVGDVFGTSSKPDAGPPIGLEGLRRICEAVSVPVVAIGGVRLDNAASAVMAGASGVAVISAVFASDDPYISAFHLRGVVDEALREVGRL